MNTQRMVVGLSWLLVICLAVAALYQWVQPPEVSLTSKNSSIGAGLNNRSEQVKKINVGDALKKTGIAFAGSQSCMGCHEKIYKQWQQSDHYKAMQVATNETVLGDFSDISVEFHGVTSRLYKQGKQFFVDTLGNAPKNEPFEIIYTFGFQPLQQYLVELPDGHVQALNIAWDSRDKKEGGQRWFHLRPDENINPDHPFFWTRHFQNWNSRCAECHTTDFQKNYRSQTHEYESSWSEVNVACEACHGPAAAHIELARAGSVSKGSAGFARIADKPLRWEFSPDAAIALPAGKKGDSDVNTCGRCHSLRSQLAAGQLKDFHDQYRLQLLGSGGYFDDGQILEEVFVLGSFLQSTMHAKGVSCSNCHNPHTGKLLVEGNALCAQCHKPEFFDTTAHHHHPAGSAGSACVNCHMPARTYMQVDNRRDHSFTIPRPDLSKKLAVPNACVNCHAGEPGKDNQWAVEALRQWGVAATPADHWAVLNHGVQSGDPQLLRALSALLNDSSQPSIIRASLLERLVSIPSQQSVSAAKKSLQDESPLIRRGAVSALEFVPGELRWQLLSPHLGDTNRSVRIEAARVLADLLRQLPADKRVDLQNAIEEYRNSLLLSVDAPATQVALASFESRLGNVHEADLAYQHALVIEPNYIPALINLAEHYRNSARADKAEALLEKALNLAPDSGMVQHSYGLHLIRKKEYTKAQQHLKLAVSAVDAQPRYDYVYAVALESNGQIDKAIDSLVSANKRWRKQYDLLMLLVAYLEKSGDTKSVQEYLPSLISIAPSDPKVQELVQQYGSG